MVNNLETAINFYQSFLTEEELESLRKKAIMITSEEEAKRLGLSYTTFLSNNLFKLCFETYKLQYESDKIYLDKIRRSGL